MSRTYLIHNKATGEVVHVHSENTDVATPLEEILGMVDQSLSRRELAVLEIKGPPPSGGCRVDVKAKVVSKVGAAEVLNFGGALQHDTFEPPMGVKVVYRNSAVTKRKSK